MILRTITATVRMLCGAAVGQGDPPEDADLAALGVVDEAADRVRAPIERLYAAVLSREEVARSGTTGRLGAQVFGAWDPGAFPVAYPLRRRGEGPPLFCVHGLPGEGSYARTFSVALGGERPLFALRAVGHAARETPLPSFSRIVDRYVAEVTSIAPDGPLILLGWCGGTWVALEMARRMRAAGREVLGLVLVDPEVNPSHAPALSLRGVPLLWRRGRSLRRMLRARIRFARLSPDDGAGRRYLVRAAFAAALGTHVPTSCDVPTLLLHSTDRRPALLDARRGLPAYLPRLEHEELADDHDSLFAPRCRAVAASARRFLDRIAPLGTLSA